MMNNGEPKSYTLANLRKYNKYDFFLVPFFKTVEGQPSNSMVVQTNEDGKWTLLMPSTTLYFRILVKQPTFLCSICSSFCGSRRRTDWYGQRHYRVHTVVGTSTAARQRRTVGIQSKSLTIEDILTFFSYG